MKDIQQPPVIRTDRLVLRQWKQEDLEPFANLNADSKVMEYFPGLKPNGVVDIALKTDIDFQAHLISSKKERDAALDFRQKHFFDRLHIQDPYTWTLDKKDHLHWLLYDRF